MTAQNRINSWNNYRLQICLLFAVIIISPVIYNLFPLHFFSPDIQYVKAKVLQVLQGNLFEDPITGYPTMHPPFYHYFLALLSLVGIPIDISLLLVTISNVLLIFFFVFKIIERQFDTGTAFVVTLAVPFIIEFMGCSYLFLASAFFFSIPIFLAGIFLYLKHNRTTRQAILSAFLWGLAYLISPIYVFLIGFTLLYELLISRNYRFFITASLTLLVTLIPFFYQLYVIYSRNLFGASTFALWRGLPDGQFIYGLIIAILSPIHKQLASPFVWIALTVSLVGIFGAFRFRAQEQHRGNIKFVIIAAVAYLFTYYHFQPQYAIRIQFFLSIFLFAFAVALFQPIAWKKIWPIIIVALIVGSGVYVLFDRVTHQYGSQQKALRDYTRTRDRFGREFEKFVLPNEMILASHGTYRHYILPWHPVRGLMAYKSGEYFQLPSALAESLKEDYRVVLNCTNRECLSRICSKHQINIAVAYSADLKFPVFQFIDKNWQKIYDGQYFRIYRRP